MNTQSGAASSLLSSEVAKKVKEHGIVLWLDAESHYAGFAAALRAGAHGFPYPVFSFDGSYLELLMALKNIGSKLDPEKVLIHLPGLNKETVKQTPVYELYKAGSLFERSLATLVQHAAVGVARPVDIEAFVKAPGLSLEGADAWLEAQRTAHADDLALVLGTLTTEEVVLGLVVGDRRVTDKIESQGEKILAFLEKALGLTDAWRTLQLGSSALSKDSMGTLVASWLMAVEFVDDLKEPPVTPELAALSKLGPFAKECRRFSARLRELHADTYETLANDVQRRFEEERKGHEASKFGSIDTFRFEEAAVRVAVIRALREGKWAIGNELAAARTAESCFWVKRSPTRQRTWEVLRHAARVGLALDEASGLGDAASLDAAAERYASALAPVDRHHRVFEQRFHAQIGSDLEDYDALLEVRSAVRRAYREWANALSRAFHELCVSRGPLPSASFRQRGVYASEVQPRLEGGARVAYVMVDALRFEMAQALSEELAKEKYRVSLKPRLAELPTVTAVGMNALAPVEQAGRLRAVIGKGDIKGFSSGEFQVLEPTDRLKAITKRSSDASKVVELELEHFHELSVGELKKKLSGKSLVVVRSLDLDTAGESELHLSTFERTLTQLKSAVSMLAQAGVPECIIVADHGFLLQDATVEIVPLGANMNVPSRRHASLSKPSGMPDVLELTPALLDYDADEPIHFVFRPDTAVWKTSSRVASFVHGGNSLQERVIPVLHTQREGPLGKRMSSYEVVARAEPAHLGRQRLQVAVQLQAHANAMLSPPPISLALRAVDGSGGVVLTLLDAQPPAKLVDGRVFVPANREESLVEFELVGPIDERVRVEIFHPDAAENVSPTIVSGFFDVARDRRQTKPKDAEARAQALATGEAPKHPSTVPPAPAKTQSWHDSIEDAGYRKAFQIIEESRMINETELTQLLGSPRLVRAFTREYERLTQMLPFPIEIVTIDGVKAWRRGD